MPMLPWWRQMPDGQWFWAGPLPAPQLPPGRPGPPPPRTPAEERERRAAWGWLAAVVAFALLAGLALAIFAWRLSVMRRKFPGRSVNDGAIVAMGVLAGAGVLWAQVTVPVINWIANGLNCGL